MLKFSFWVAVLGIVALTAMQAGQMYYNNSKILNVFEGAAIHLKSEPAAQVKARLPALFNQANVDLDMLPQAFFDNLDVKKNNGKLQLSSEYQVTLWVFGAPSRIDALSDDEASELSLIDKIKSKARFELFFSPYWETP